MPLKTQAIYTALLASLFSFSSIADAKITNVNGVEIEILIDHEHLEAAKQNHLPNGFEENLTYYAPDYQPKTNTPTTPLVEALTNSQLASSHAYNPSHDVWDRVRSGFGMPERHYALTSKHENWFATHDAYMQKVVARSQRYLFHVVEALKARNMPTELALLPVIESAYNPNAYSRSHAAGMWQFIPSTGRKYGLKQSFWADNRRDIVAATDAALTYLQELHGMFGEWDLALAAYNAGEGRVSRAIARNRAKGLPTDYQHITLPNETRNYVPKLMAVKHIVAAPHRFGLSLTHIPNQPYFKQVDAPAQIDTKLVIELAGITSEEFKALNPSHNRPVALTRGHAVPYFLLPVAAANRFEANLAQHDQRLTTWKPYHAKRGEQISTIARKFGLSTSELKQVNGIKRGSRISTSRALLVPNHSTKEHPLHLTQFKWVKPRYSSKKSVVYRVKRGDTLSRIAKRYGVTSTQIKRANGLRSSRIKVGQRLKIASSKRTSSARRYKVKRGDTVSTIAKRFGVSTRSLKRANNLRTNTIRVGQRLII